MNKLKARLIKHYLPLTVFSILLVIIFKIIWTKKNIITLITDISGYIAIVLLSLTLIIGTLNILLKRNNPTSTYFRRDIGIFGGILTLVHSVFGLFAHMRGKMWQYFLIETEYGYTIRLDDFGIANYTGVISTIFIIVLILISNDYSLKKIKIKRWKNIQRLSYIMFIFAIVHVIYYRVILEKLDLVYYTYLMMTVIVLIFQIIGFSLRMKRKFIT